MHNPNPREPSTYDVLNRRKPIPWDFELRRQRRRWILARIAWGLAIVAVCGAIYACDQYFVAVN